MFCPKCGTDNPDDARFCGDCGNAMPVSEPNPSTSRPQTRSASSVTGGSSTGTEVSQGLKIGIIIAAIIVPLVGIIMGLIYMLDSNASQEKKGVGRTWLFVGIGAIVLWFLLFSSQGF